MPSQKSRTSSTFCNCSGVSTPSRRRKYPGRQSLDTLDEESACSEKPRRHGNLESRAADRGEMRHDPDERPVFVRVGNADDQRRADFLRDAEVHLPHLAALRSHGGHPLPRRASGTCQRRGPQSHRPSGRRTLGYARRWRGAIRHIPAARAARPRRGYGQLPESWTKSSGGISPRKRTESPLV